MTIDTGAVVLSSVSLTHLVPCRGVRTVAAGAGALRGSRRVAGDVGREREDLSPGQIAGALRKRHAAGSRMRVSPAAIQNSLFVQSRGVLEKDLQKHLGSGRQIRRSVHKERGVATLRGLVAEKSVARIQLAG